MIVAMSPAVKLSFSSSQPNANAGIAAFSAPNISSVKKYFKKGKHSNRKNVDIYLVSQVEGRTVLRGKGVEVLTVMIDAGYTFSSSSNLGTFWILPIAIIETSGTLIRGEPNFPPIAPILLRVIVPPVISSVLSLLARANCCSRDNSFVI
ncbi:tRNA 2-thiocytidine biosynthesis protein TtcA [Striga asiatica]|uniref:tRNA 2-thiocytidine biosynthesis protein TtcA n=1 Tax=Striga asiatica TaxID=4170 RepID=A0A5A7R602_STRAF|nr:tRNA 2-thiocytidine biosynthesis protein TtcA [Striga asiatica]